MLIYVALQLHIATAFETIDVDMLSHVWQELDITLNNSQSL